MIEQRPQASSQNFQAKRGASLTNLNRGASQKTELTAKRRAGTHKMEQRCRRKEMSSKKLSPSRAEFGNGEIGPAANEMRSTTPKSSDEWAPGL